MLFTITISSWKGAGTGNSPGGIILIFFLVLIVNRSIINWPKRCRILRFQLMFPYYVRDLGTLWSRLIGLVWNRILFGDFFMELKWTKAFQKFLLFWIFSWLLLLLLLLLRLRLLLIWLRMVVLRRRLMLENYSLAHINRFFICFFLTTTLLPITQNILPRGRILLRFANS